MKKRLLLGVVATILSARSRSRPSARPRPSMPPPSSRRRRRPCARAILQAVQYSGTGSTFPLGQAPRPGAPWPRFKVIRYVAAVNYNAPAMREELVRVDVEDPPHGGGAGPYNPATGQGGIRPIPGEQTQTQIRDAGTDSRAPADLDDASRFLEGGRREQGHGQHGNRQRKSAAHRVVYGARQVHAAWNHQRSESRLSASKHGLPTPSSATCSSTRPIRTTRISAA